VLHGFCILLASAAALRLVSFEVSAGFMIAVFAPLDSNESAYPHANKLRGFVRISPERKSSKIEKPDNKPITAFSVLGFRVS